MGSTFAGLFFSVFGLTELSSFDTKSKLFNITKDTGKVLFGFFLLVVTIVAVNMLIAMMTRSFEAIAVSINKYYTKEQWIQLDK